MKLTCKNVTLPAYRTMVRPETARIAEDQMETRRTTSENCRTNAGKRQVNEIEKGDSERGERECFTLLWRRAFMIFPLLIILLQKMLSYFYRKLQKWSLWLLKHCSFCQNFLFIRGPLSMEVVAVFVPCLCEMIKIPFVL